MGAFQKCNLHTIFYEYFTHMKTEITNLFGWHREKKNMPKIIGERYLFIGNYTTLVSDFIVFRKFILLKTAQKGYFGMPKIPYPCSYLPCSLLYKLYMLWLRIQYLSSCIH